MTTLVFEADSAAVDVEMTTDSFTVNLTDGRSFSIPLAWYPRLSHASSDEKNNWQLLGDGYAIE